MKVKDSAYVTVRGNVAEPPRVESGQTAFVVGVSCDPGASGGDRGEVTVFVRARVVGRAATALGDLRKGDRVVLYGRLLPTVRAGLVEVLAVEVGRSL